MLPTKPNILVQVDAFTDKPFAGNPAAICILTQPRDDAWMQSMAAEMNLSETAFLLPHEDPFKQAYHLRWFTPKVEVNLCGHATLASAHVLWSEGYLRPDQVARFHTKSGELTATYDTSTWITLDFPARLETQVEAPAGLAAALGTEILYIGRNADDYVVEISAESLPSLTPDFVALAKIKDVRGVCVTAKGSGDYDFVSRFFAPASGVDEDPVTGSAHCCLTPYWSKKLGKSEMFAYQASARGGSLRVTWDGGERVQLSGKAVTVLRGELL